LIGSIVGVAVFLTVGSYSGLIARSALKLWALALTLTVVLCIPVLVYLFEVRSGTYFARFYIFDVAMRAYSQHPFLGVGFNNGTASLIPGKQELREMGIQVPLGEAVNSYYLGILIEVGLIGAVLLFGFFGTIVMIGLRTVKEIPTDMKPLLVGIVAGLLSLATQSLLDAPMAGHAVSGMLWLFAALVVAIARPLHAETPASSWMGRARRAAVDAKPTDAQRPPNSLHNPLRPRFQPRRAVLP
jgi:O-antigen ligase